MRRPKVQEEFGSINDLRKKELLQLIRKNPKMNFQDIFALYPKSAFARACGLHTTAFSCKVDKPQIIRVDEILKIAAYLGLEPEEVLSLIVRSIKPAKSARKPAGRKK